MEIYKAMEQRYSVRAYKDTPVEQEKLERILRAAQIAPTAANKQAFKIFIYPTEKYKKSLEKVYNRPWFTESPIVLLVCTETDKCWVRRDGKSYGDVDSAIVMDHIILASSAEGLGTCWVGAFDAQVAKNELSIPDNLEPVAFTPIGYANDTVPEMKRKDLSEIVEYK